MYGEFDPRGGNDQVLANGGNNIIVASADDDTITDDTGLDRLGFAGELAEYDFTRENFSDDSEEEIGLIFTHTNVGGHGFNEGTEVVTGVEFFGFGTETFTKEQLENAIVGKSELFGTGDGELIFLNENDTQIDGLSLNGKESGGVNVVYGLGCDDRIQGTQCGDYIFGGAGNDLLVPRSSRDALDGGTGIDIFQVFDIGDNPRNIVNLTTGFAPLNTGFKERANVENAIVLHGGGLEIIGKAQANILFSGRGNDMLSGREGNDALFGNAGRDVLPGGQGADTLRGGDQGDLLVAGGGRTVSVSVDLKRGFVTREVEERAVVWADCGGGQTPRSCDAQSISPENVLRSDPFYALSADDLALRLPTGDVEKLFPVLPLKLPLP